MQPLTSRSQVHPEKENNDRTDESVTQFVTESNFVSAASSVIRLCNEMQRRSEPTS